MIKGERTLHRMGRIDEVAPSIKGAVDTKPERYERLSDLADQSRPRTTSGDDGGNEKPFGLINVWEKAVEIWVRGNPEKLPLSLVLIPWVAAAGTKGQLGDEIYWLKWRPGVIRPAANISTVDIPKRQLKVNVLCTPSNLNQEKTNHVIDHQATERRTRRGIRTCPKLALKGTWTGLWARARWVHEQELGGCRYGRKRMGMEYGTSSIGMRGGIRAQPQKVREAVRVRAPMRHTSTTEGVRARPREVADTIRERCSSTASAKAHKPSGHERQDVSTAGLLAQPERGREAAHGAARGHDLKIREVTCEHSLGGAVRAQPRMDGYEKRHTGTTSEAAYERRARPLGGGV
ncbi:hypothetical protein DFH09DRAFT_1457358 [Mycena vulgaris]|nr:hypothetical protein DFH09DRAFT_1457358 [Mycena vulgaris]